VIENTAMRYNLIPLEISLNREGENWFVRIFIHNLEKPVTHEDCAHITRGLGELLDDLIPFKYYLEVSSPGVDRKLKSPREYLVFKGKTALVKVKTPIDESGEKKIEVKLNGYQEGLGLNVIKLSGGKEFTIPLDNIFSVQLDDRLGEKND
jgi:ribosome maturation factor RimP